MNGRAYHTVLVTKLQRVDDTEDLVEVATRRCRVRDSQADDLLRVDDEDGADGERETLRVDVRRILVIKHVVQLRKKHCQNLALHNGAGVGTYSCDFAVLVCNLDATD